MPRPWQTLDRELGEYLNELRDKDLNEVTTIKPYEWALRRQFQALIDFKKQWNPRKISKEEIVWLRDEFLTGHPRYKENQIKILLGFLRWAGNRDVDRWHIHFGDTSPTHRRWLEKPEAQLIKAEAKGIERIIIHCELDLLMRRKSVLSLTVGSFVRGSERKVNYRGKGRHGGPNKSVGWHPDTGEMFNEYLDIRQSVIDKARKKNPKVKVPDALLIYELGGKLYPYKKTAIDDFLCELGGRVGFHFSNHDLRRTGGRLMYKAGVPIEKISKILGHRDIKTTIEYLGLNIDDMSESLAQYAQYMKNPFEPKMVQNDEGQEIGGQSGI